MTKMPHDNRFITRFVSLFLFTTFLSAASMEISCGRGPCICERGDAGDKEVKPWGEFAATMDVPECPASEHPPLVVNTTTDELDGGEGIADPLQASVHLSFVEAMWIAANRDGHDTILFDPEVFLVDRPATILLTGKHLGLYGALDIYASSVIENNVFAAETRAISFFPDKRVTIRNNYFGVDREGSALPRSVVGIQVDNGNFTIGPGNIVRGVVVGINVNTITATAQITRNSISGNKQGIFFSGPPPVDPPEIVSATSRHVLGKGSVEGTVEIFSDPGDQGETFLGDVYCNGSSPWSLDVSVPGGRNVTATLTDTGGRTSCFSKPYHVP